MYSLTDGLFKGGLAPEQNVMIAFGAGLAVLLIITDKLLQQAGSTFRTPVMPVAVGIYLPVGLSVPIFVGGLAAFAIERYYKSGSSVRLWAQDARTSLGQLGERAAILLGSGLIAGEAILGIGTAFLSAQDPPMTLGFDGHHRHNWAGFLLMGYFAFLVYYVGIRPGLKAKREGLPADLPPPSSGGHGGH